MVEVVSVGAGIARALSGMDFDMPVYCRIGKDGDRLIATGGLAWGAGRCWLFFSVEEGAPSNIVRPALRECAALLRKAAQLGETEVYTPRDAEYATSERLCKLAGFEKTDEVFDGLEIWVFKWRHLEQ